METQSIVRLERVSKSFANDKIIQELNLIVSKFDFISVVGASGSGKSTLLNLISGLTDADTGSIEIFSNFKPIVVFQEYSKANFPWLNVIDNVKIALNDDLSESSKIEKSIKYLELVGLGKDLKKYPKELSGGMQQRLIIARALVKEPEILLLDEPFGSLDFQLKKDLEILLLELCKQFGITVVLVTHDIDEAIFLSNRVLIFSKTQENRFKEINIDIPYPRDFKKVISTEKFNNYRSQIISNLV